MKRPAESLISALSLDTGNWHEVYCVSLGRMIATQNACRELVVREQNWNVDFSRGVILFGGQEYALQFIGSESASSGTWLWGWENINGFPDELIELARRTRQLGERWGLEPLTQAQFSLDDTFNGHALSTVTCALAGDCCYYRCPHSGGAAFVAFSGVPEEVFAPVDMQKFVSITMQCIREIPLDHRLFVEGFLLGNGTPYERDGLSITAHFEQKLHLEFEQAGGVLRIRSIKSR
ncbi:DUF6882 domain-containing protein [Feifania hominis]|uniref:Uncharacterized protein n=1 Tax=Feifania hominis TaxID=2763660 RepID=A0A926HUX5_9FIRM|nr:DUF6882 domain-containing protein [Feifania hominis]MBC8536390.1 hypothetical protein [Feifania hominis]